MNRRGALSILVATLTAATALPLRGSDSSVPAASTPKEVKALVELGQRGPGLRPEPTEHLSLSVPRRMDLSHVEPGYFAAALGKDPRRIFDYVRDYVAFEAYAGVLRGPRGTLLAMAGNAPDRASLLAKLLTESGQRVRFARGVLDESRARVLVTSMWTVPTSMQSGSSFPAVPMNVTGSISRLTASIEANGRLLHDALKAAGHPAAGQPAATIAAMVKQVQEHYWVQWMQNGTWTDLDPSFEGASPGQTFASVAETFEALPDALFHRVDIRVRLEEYTDATPSSREILRYNAKAADLSGLDLLFAHQAEGTPQDNRFKPLLVVGPQRITGSPFQLKAPAGNAAASAADALGGGPDPVAVAVAESIAMEFVGPGQRPETVVREIFDHVGRGRRMTKQRLTAAQAASSNDGVNNVDFSRALYDLLVTTGSIDARHLRGLSDAPPPKEIDLIDVRAGLRRINVTLAAASDAILRHIVGDSGATYRFYLDTPRVLIADMRLKADLMSLNIDLRRDRVKIATSGSRSDQLFYAHVLQGVVNGSLERTVIEHFAGPPRPDDGRLATSFSTASVFESVFAAKMPTVVLARGGAAAGSDVPENARARIEEAVAQGHLVLAPRRPVTIGTTPRFAWWQVDPRSGATIAVTEEGLHQANVEAVVTRRAGGEIHFEFFINGKHYPYQAQNFANGPMARQFISGLFHELAGRGIIFKVITWTSLM